MNKYEQIKLSLNKLIEGNTNEEQVKNIGEVLATVDEAEQENKGLQEQHNNLVLEYGKAIKYVSSNEKPNDEKEEPMTLEAIINKVANEK